MYYGERVIVPRLNKRVGEITPIGLALIVYKLVSVLTLIADEIVPIGLALIVYKMVSVLTSIADKIMPIAWFGIDCLQVSVHGNINS